MGAPSRIDRYELLGSLGQGATGIVYLAKDSKLDREVALKVISPEVAQNPAIRSLFHREAKAISMLHHTNIIALHDYSGPDSAIVYLVVERLKGQTLGDWVEKRKRPIPPVFAAAMAHGICAALAHAHSMGILHRDLKPENVFLEPDGRIVLCDFGIARDYLSGVQNTLASQKTTLAGSPLYMSPEQILKPQSVGPASDLFALGSVLYFLVTGVHAFDGGSMPKTLKNVSDVKFKRIYDVSKMVPMPYANIVHRLLQKDPTKRYASAQQVALELRDFVAQEFREPQLALAHFLMSAQQEKQNLPATQVVSLDALQGDRMHSTIMLTQKKKIAVLQDEEPPVTGPHKVASPGGPKEVIPTPLKRPTTFVQKKPASLGVLLWSIIFATSIVVVGIVLAELPAAAPVRAWLQRTFQK